MTPPSRAELRVRASAINHPLLAPVVFDDRDGLSPDEAAVLAVLANPALKTLRDGRLIAKAQLLQAGLLPNPQLILNPFLPTGGNTNGSHAGFNTALGINAAQIITRHAQMDAAERQVMAVDLDIAWQEWQTAQAAKSGTYRLHILLSQVFLAEELNRLLSEMTALMRNAEAEGLITEPELVAVEMAGNKAHADSIDLKKQTDQQRLLLNQLLGLPAGTQIITGRNIDTPAEFTPPPLETLLAGLEERRLDLLGLRHGYESQEANVRAAVLRQFPNIQIGFTEQRNNTGVYMTGLNVVMNLPVFDRNQGEIALQEATRQRLYDEYTHRVFQARADIGKLLSLIGWLNRQIQTEQAALPVLNKQAENLRAAFNGQQADISAYYKSLGNLTARKTQILQLKQRLLDAAVALEAASGIYMTPGAPREKSAS